MCPRKVPRTVNCVLFVAVLLVGGCGVEQGGVEDAGPAPTGLAQETVLYFLDADGSLESSARETGRLGTVLGAVQLLLSGTSDSEEAAGLHSDVPVGEVSPSVVDAGGYVHVDLPFDATEIGPDGIDQVICTATAVITASGRDPDGVDVTVGLTSGEQTGRPCPLLR